MKIIKAKSLALEKATHGDYLKQLYLKDGEAKHIHQLGRVVIPNGISTADHGHDGKYEIFLIEKGKGIVTFNNTDERQVEEGDFILTESHETHKISNPYAQDLVLIFLEVKD